MRTAKSSTADLQTDRPHVLKLYGSYEFPMGTALSGRFNVSSGTPLSTMVENMSGVPMLVNGRGDMGRTPVLSNTDLLVSHEFNIAEGKKLRFEFNALNVFNQKTARYRQVFMTRFRDPGSAMDMSAVNLLNGYDWKKLLSETEYAANDARTSIRSRSIRQRTSRSIRASGWTTCSTLVSPAGSA